jgi:hypothetical protein
MSLANKILDRLDEETSDIDKLKIVRKKNKKESQEKPRKINVWDYVANNIVIATETAVSDYVKSKPTSRLRDVIGWTRDLTWDQEGLRKLFNDNTITAGSRNSNFPTDYRLIRALNVKDIINELKRNLRLKREK